MLNPQQIKKALVRLAEFQKRPPYEPMTVREIISNFSTHPLREAILYFCEPDANEQKVRLTELRVLCTTNMAKDIAKERTGLDIRALLRGDQLLTDHTWMLLKKHWDYIDDKCYRPKPKPKIYVQGELF